MIDLGKKNVLGVFVDALDYEAAVERIIQAAQDGRPYSATALAVHGVMTGVKDDAHRYRLNRFDLITPDGQPVRWALNLLHKTRLPERVYGPTLTLLVCDAAAKHGIPVFFYGSRQEVLDRLERNLIIRFPSLTIAGSEPSKFRRVSREEHLKIAKGIRNSGARITFVGLGCPRQEVFAYEYSRLLTMPTVAVGAAFDYHAGNISEPPDLVQRLGLQWVHRLLQDPRRLWRRYLLLNPEYIVRVLAQATRLFRPAPNAAPAPVEEHFVA